MRRQELLNSSEERAMHRKKLEEEQQNLVRVNDILSELTRQLEPLERQAETAKIYLKKKEELKILRYQSVSARDGAHPEQISREVDRKVPDVQKSS